MAVEDRNRTPLVCADIYVTTAVHDKYCCIPLAVRLDRRSQVGRRKNIYVKIRRSPNSAGSVHLQPARQHDGMMLFTRMIANLMCHNTTTPSAYNKGDGCGWDQEARTNS